MSLTREVANEQEWVEFSWGCKKRKGVVNKDIQCFESFTYDGLEYHLYDCVYLWRNGVHELDIGKIVKVWETASHKKKVRIVWIFRPADISNWLGNVKPLKNEIFLASGEGIGLCNLNPLEAICGKCKVICTSKDSRNSQISDEETEGADYIFSRTFDVGNCKILDTFPDYIAGHKVEHFFNKRKVQKNETLNSKAKLKVESGAGRPARAIKEYHSSRTAKPIEEAAGFAKPAYFSEDDTRLKPKEFIDNGGNGAKTLGDHYRTAKKRDLEDSPPLNAADSCLFKKRTLQTSLVGSEEDSAKCSNLIPGLPDYIQNILSSKHSFSDKKGLSSKTNISEKASTSPDDGAIQSGHHKGLRTARQNVDVSRRPDLDSSKWFKEEFWPERLQKAHETGCLVLLENLDPSYTSSEVEDIVWNALQKKASAKMIQGSSFCSPHNGQALVIFKSKDAADSALYELSNSCLMLNDQRPILARRRALREPGNPTKFSGHLDIDKFKYQKQLESQKNAVSTSHCSQQNTIEYEMAMNWRLLQKKSDLWWDALYKQQAKEIDTLISQLKSSSKN